MRNLPNGNRETTPTHEAADGRADTDKPINGMTCSDLTNTPAFAKWLIQYRNRLSMMMDGDSGARRTGFRGERENDSGVKTNTIPG